MEGALRRPWRVGGPFRTWESFFVLWEINLFFVSKIPASHWCLGVPPSPLLHSSLPYVMLHCRTVALLLLFCFFSTHKDLTGPPSADPPSADPPSLLLLNMV